MIIIRLALLILLLPILAWAGEDSWLEKDRFNFNFGSFNVNFDSTARISGDSLGTRLDFEDVLGLNNTDTVLRVLATYRVSERSTVLLGYVNLDRDGENRIDRDIIIDDTLYPAGTRLDSTFDYRSLKFAYTHSIWQTSGYDIGLSAGLLVFDYDLEVKAEGNALDDEGDDATSPFPMLGLRGSWQLQPSLFLRAHYEYFAVDDGDIEGDLEDYMVALEYRFAEAWGAGLGYNYQRLDVENVDSNDELVYEYDGLMLYLNLVY